MADGFSSISRMNHDLSPHREMHLLLAGHANIRWAPFGSIQTAKMDLNETGILDRACLKRGHENDIAE